MILFAEPDVKVRATFGDVPELPGVMQTDPEWGLDRIDQRTGISSSYSPGLDGGYGKGVHVYILDTGILSEHSDFENRAIPTLDATQSPMEECNSGDYECAKDRNGHGTHCAGVVGGKKYGVAKEVTLHAVKVLNDDGTASISYTLKALDWLARNAQQPAVVSMSLGSKGIISSYQQAIDAVFNTYGIVVVVAAGNDDENACYDSPAFVPNAITVGATAMPTSSGTDLIAWYSNYGPCVDIMAPGSDITSCGIASSWSRATMSGTSMACPAVSGAAALILAMHKDDSPSFNPRGVSDALLRHATIASYKVQPFRGYHSKPGTTRKMLYIGPEWTRNGGTPSKRKPNPGAPQIKINRLFWIVAALLICCGMCCCAGIRFLIRAVMAREGTPSQKPLLG